MSVNETKLNTLVSVQNDTETSNVSAVDKQDNNGTALSKIFTKLAEGKDFIFKTLKEKSGALITLGQVGGVAAMTLGGLSMVFTGLAANLTVVGIPLGIPLLAGGAILFTAGTGLLIAKLAMNVKSTLGEKIKTFFNVTGKNMALGLGAGVLSAGIFSKVTPAVLVATGKEISEKMDEIEERGKQVKNVFNQALDVGDKVNEQVNQDLSNMDKGKPINKSDVQNQKENVKELDKANNTTDESLAVEQNPEGKTSSKEVEEQIYDESLKFIRYLFGEATFNDKN